MSGIQKHNKKSWSDYERYATHVYDEKFLLELFHNERDYEQQFLCREDGGLRTSNCAIGYWKAETNYISRDGNDYFLFADFVAPTTGEYNVEVLYRTETEGSFSSLWSMDSNEQEEYLKGSPEFRNRIIRDYHLQQGEHTFQLTCNSNIHVIGIVVKNITEYRADDTLSRESRLTLIKATHTVSKMVGADELKVELLYDNAWKDPTSLTDYIFDYREEVNFHLINTDGEMEQVFGGYISSCSLNSAETILTLNCAGRFIDGEKRYIVEEMNVGGTASVLEDSFPTEYIRRFENYNDATEYLFDNYEQPLSSNMHDIITAKQYDAIRFDVSNADNFNRCIADNIQTRLMPLGAYLRNNSGKSVTQKYFIYDKDWFNSEPILLDDFPIFYIRYGMGEPVTQLEVEQSSTDGSSTSSTSGGGIITVNMMPSCGCCGYPKNPYKRVQKSWKNYCPNCKKSGTLTDNPKGVYEGEITCSMRKGGCDADYCGFCGGDKWGGNKCARVKLTPASASEGANSGDGTSNTSKSTINVIKAVVDECCKYNYGVGVSTINNLRKYGYGDDKAFSDLIFSALSDYGVACKIVQYNNGAINDFRSVLVKDKSGNFVDFPYTSEGFKKHFGSVLNPTGASKTGSVQNSSDGLGVDVSTGFVEGTNTVSNGFDKDKMMMFYIVLEYSISDDPNASHQFSFIDFTASKPDNYMTWSGLTPISLNNIINTSTVNVIDRMREQEQIPHVYLHKLYFEYKIGDEPLWENSDNNTDNSSYRMILQEVGFRNGTLLNPVDLGSTGKTINSVLQTVVDSGELKLKFYPAKHRRDDKVIVTKDKSFNPNFTLDESKNVISLSNQNTNPVSDFNDRHLVVFKNKMEDEEKGAVYNYTESRSPTHVLRYGEINKITSLSDDISIYEAYYTAKHDIKTDIRESVTATVVGNPKDLHIGDYVECIFEENTYNDIKEVQSIEREYDINQAPHIQTKLGLNRPNPELNLRKEFEEQRKQVKEQKALFSTTAIYNDDINIFEG